MPANEATASARPWPAPYDGWNAQGNLANMKPTEALLMDNVFPGTQNVGLRKGSITWATGAGANIKSLLPYNGLTANSLFAGTNSGIYNATANGAIGGVAQACTNGRWFHINFTTPGGQFMFLVNGTDSALHYNGAVWATPVITVATSSTWSQVTAHKQRIWAVQKNTMNVWYLPTQSIAGAATVFPVGSLFKKGGAVLSIGTWTIDGGAGVDDLLVIATTRGEIAIYQGTDPAGSATWALVGVYEVPEPVGDSPLMNYGGDLLYSSKTGLLPLSTLLQSQLIDRAALISYKIDGAFIDAALDYSTVVGWQMILHKAANLLIVNIPVSADTVAYQFVMNTVTKRWCRFTGWNATCWANLGGSLYYAGGTSVRKAWTGVDDEGAPIVGTVAQAYSNLGVTGQKNIVLCRPNFGIAGSCQISLALDTDFKTFSGDTEFSYAPVTSGAIWGTSLWDTGLWAGGASLFEPTWRTVPGDLGYLHSFRLQVTTSSANFVWTNTDFAYKRAGIL